MDMEMAADGTVWLLEYGADWYFNKNGRIRRMLPGRSQPSRPVGSSRVRRQRPHLDRVGSRRRSGDRRRGG